MKTFALLFLLNYLINDVSGYKVEIVSRLGLNIGEAPHWDVNKQSLYFVDLFGNWTIFRYDYYEDRVYRAIIFGESQASFVIPIKCCKNQFAVGLERAVKIIKWNGKSPLARVLRTVFAVEQDAQYSANHMNDAKADPKGRFYGGTLRSELCSFSTTANASFYRYTKSRGVQKLFDDVKVSNGMAWNKRRNKFYYSDSCRYELREYDWDPYTGNINNGRTVFNYRTSDQLPSFVPDGLTIDCNGFLYSAVFNGSAVYKIDPKTNTLAGVINMPTQIITSAAWGAPDLKTLFVTSGSLPRDLYTGEDNGAVLSESAGALFRVTGLGARGLPGQKLCL